MRPAVLVRLRPLGPWRSGPGEGGRLAVDPLFRSDRLFSALTLAFADLGFLDEWLDATVRAEEPAVRLGSLFPYQAETLFAVPPPTIWPPAANQVTSPSPVFLSKLRWAEAQFVPVSLLQTLLQGQAVLADQWMLDAESGCLLRRDRPSSSPFRTTTRRRVAVDRVTGVSGTADALACIEFEASAGLWTAITFADAPTEEYWRLRMEAAFRLLADTGFGAGRKIGWGHFAVAGYERGKWPAMLMPKLAGAWRESESPRHWLLSLFSPAPKDAMDWSGGHYRLTRRAGNGQKFARFVEEGSVVVSDAAPVGRAVDVSGNGAAHPVYRSGIALSVSLPEVVVVEATPSPEATPEPTAKVPDSPDDAASEPVEPIEPEDRTVADAAPNLEAELTPEGDLVQEDATSEPVSSDGIEPVGFDQVISEGLSEGAHSEAEKPAPEEEKDHEL